MLPFKFFMSISSNSFITIVKNSNLGFNPFISQRKIYQYPNENSYMRAFFEEPEIRCPICLGRVFTPVRPNCCTHVYCLYCLKKWNFTSKLCPICRKKVASILKVDIHEPWLKTIKDEFIK